ncbi:Elongator subunit elp4 [Coemansia guatemalensis]|uniref:Elongator complex protein 4 n=1 Tax=Coemansia guatemalensis TaxID=2761395 RepID=A0A9W8LPY9_9FUNG|nr:Elongator subunit elp4 [Coemansia guatemalensis]
MSSFRRNTAGQQTTKPPPATRLNPHSAQLLVSTGVPSLDDVLGGGLPVGGILLIEEDRQTDYSSTLLSYFASQAIAAGHELCIVDADQEVALKDQLPGWASTAHEMQAKSGLNDKSSAGSTPDEPMKIAWRYQNMPRIDSDRDDYDGKSSKDSSTLADARETPFCERFDLSLRIQPKVIEDATIEIVTGASLLRASNEDHGGDMYKCVLDRIARLVDDRFSSLKPAAPGANRNILRIEIRSLGSGFWQGSDSLSILKFLHRLRGILRYSYAVCVVSFPAHLYEDGGVRMPVVRRVEHLCDAVIQLESFEGTFATPSDIVARQSMPAAAAAASDYHGFLHIRKLPRLNSLTASMGRLSLLHSGGGSTNNLAFRLRRKKFSIETYHLPIEGGVTERRVPAKDEAKGNRQQVGAGVGCGSTPGRSDPLEF